MGFVLSTVATVLALLLIFYLLNRRYGTGGSGGFGPPAGGGSGAIESKRVERDRPNLVQDDIRQMFEAQNELRRRRGAGEMSEEDLRRAVAEDEANRSRGRGPFGGE